MGEHILHPIQNHTVPGAGRKLVDAIFTILTGTFDKISDLKVEFELSVSGWLYPCQWLTVLKFLIFGFSQF